MRSGDAAILASARRRYLQSRTRIWAVLRTKLLIQHIKLFLASSILHKRLLKMKSLHNFYDVAKNPHFANQAKQTSSGFCWSGDLTKILTPDQEHQRRSKISTSQRSGSRGFFYKLVSPTGSIHVTINLTEFCKTHQLNRQNLKKVARGERNHHKGWVAERMEIKQ